MIGVQIGDKHSYDDFGLILSKKEIGTLQEQSNRIDIPICNGSKDIILIPETYTKRSISCTLSCGCSEIKWNSKVSNVMNFLHGQRKDIIFDDNPDKTYVGRLEVKSIDYTKGIGSITIVALVEP